jgi:hypothetical protein
MGREKKVLRSIQSRDGRRCVDIFISPENNNFSFQEYRRDLEDNQWFPVGLISESRYETISATLAEAKSVIAWLKDDFCLD